MATARLRAIEAETHGPPLLNNMASSNAAEKKPKGKKRGAPPKEPFWCLGGMKFVKVNKYKGKKLVDIREYYVDVNSKESKPGRKGISINQEQYKTLKSLSKNIDAALKSV